MRLFALILAVVIAILSAPTPATACGGFFAGRPSSETTVPDLRSDGSRVVIARDGLHTVVSLAMRYRGPPEDFALVVPVPAVLERKQVRTLAPDVLERLDVLTRPRIVEQWEDYPCFEEVEAEAASNYEGGTGTRAKGEEGSAGTMPEPRVKVEASFSVDEYDIVILGATDSMALDAWLRTSGYAMPPRIEPFLRPYVAAGSKFFVAKVDPKKIEMSWGRASLSPIQFRYDSEAFALPIRLGLANVDGDQDLTVWVLGKDRYEIANYENVFIPTNIRLIEGAGGAFDRFYERLFRDTVAAHPKSVVTEYAWSNQADLHTLLELGGTENTDIVITRLHARYGPSFDQDFFLRPAPPLEGGNEYVGSGDLPTEGAHVSTGNRFQARYFIRHPWSDPIDCDHPHFGKWTGEHYYDAPKAKVLPDAPLDAWTFRGPDQHKARTLYDRLDHPIVFGIATLVALAIGIVIVTFLAHKGSRWKPALLLFVIGTLPAATMLPSRVWHSIREASLLQLSALVYVIAAALVTRLATRRAHAGWLAAAAMLPFLFQCVAFHLVFDRLDFPAIDPQQQARIYAEGEGEALQGLLWGAIAAALLLGVGAWSVQGESRSDPKPTKKIAAAIGIAVVANAFVYGVTASLWGTVPNAPLFAIPLVISASFLAVRRWDDRGVERIGLLFLAALFVGAASAFSARGAGLESVAGESVDPSQRGRILDATFHTMNMLFWQTPLAALCTVLPHLVVARRRVPSIRITVPAAIVLASCIGIGVAATRRIHGLWNGQIAPHDSRASIPGVDPPPLTMGALYELPIDRSLEGPALVATAKGALLASLDTTSATQPFDDAIFARMADSTLREPLDPLLVLDRTLTIARIDTALEPILRKRHLGFRFELGARPAAVSSMYAPLYEGPDLRGSVRLEWRRSIAVDAPRASDSKDGVPWSIAVRSDGGDMLSTIALIGAHGRYRRVEGAHVTSASEPSFAPYIGEILLCVSPDTTAEALATLVARLVERPRIEPYVSMMAAIHKHPAPERRFVVTTSPLPFAQ